MKVAVRLSCRRSVREHSERHGDLAVAVSSEEKKKTTFRRLALVTLDYLIPSVDSAPSSAVLLFSWSISSEASRLERVFAGSAFSPPPLPLLLSLPYVCLPCCSLSAHHHRLNTPLFYPQVPSHTPPRPPRFRRSSSSFGAYAVNSLPIAQ
jgi:hypothetical protein